MPTLYEQRNISMTPQQWAEIERLAALLNARSTRGTDAYQISWRGLFRNLADGHYHIRLKQPQAAPAGLDEAIERNQRPPELAAEPA